MSRSSGSSYDNLSDPDQLIIPLGFLDDPVDLQYATSPPRAKKHAFPLQVDTNIANILPSSTTRAEREALLEQLNDQANLIELQKRALLTQTDTDGLSDDCDKGLQDLQNITSQFQFQSGTRPVQHRIPHSSALATAPVSVKGLGRNSSPSWNRLQFEDSSHKLAVPVLDDETMPSQSNLVHASLGASIWNRMPLSSSPQYQQGSSQAFKPTNGLSRSHSMSVTSLLLLPSPIDGTWAYQPVGGCKRNSSTAGPSTMDCPPERVGKLNSLSYGPVGRPLSAQSKEFTPIFTNCEGNSESSLSATSPSSYVALTEPINYRKLLERSVNCDWNYIVDKIVDNNDQQASIFLQQKLKIGSPEQRYSIIEAIVEKAYPLMVNRFGNFLVQRCFEHGTPEQIEGIAESIKGNVLSLAMDAFGCHVVQKALDCVDEGIKAEMVIELLRGVSETVIHRYACHVWQKLFEIRWECTPPAIMSYVNQELKGMWTQVALGETGSLVVQNIFENCVDEDKRPCIEEIIENLDTVTRGQWGNWVVQHIIEHGLPQDAERALDVIIYNAASYSMDQFASKVIEKLLKCSDASVIDRYLARICNGRPERPRIPLIDIASDAHGNYLIQYILHNGTQSQRDLVAAQIRKHMVSLRGSKWGSKCAWIVERYKNQATAFAGASSDSSASSGPIVASAGGYNGHRHKDRRAM